MRAATATVSLTAVVLLLLLPGTALAEGEEAPPPMGPIVWTMDHGTVRFVGDLARVDLSIEVTNASAPQPVEWTTRFEIDERAEVVRAALVRADGAPVAARTLAIEDARRIYAETVRGPATRGPSYGRDPLRIERERRDRLDLTVFPVGPGETIRVELAIATPLRGRGSERIFVDPLGRRRDPEDPASWPGGRALEEEIVISPSPFLLAATSPGLVPAGHTLATHRFLAAPASGSAPSGEEEGREFLTLRAPRGGSRAVAVRGGGLGTRIACRWFDPERFLARHGVSAQEGTEIRLLPGPGSCGRIAPDRFDALAAPGPVAARMRPDASRLAFVVEVHGPRGPIGRFEESVEVDRIDPPDALADALTGWHRAVLARRALDAAGDDPARAAAAVAYAVDAGVLLPGTAALAVPERERAGLVAESRRTYRTDGSRLGAPDGEADLKSPPAFVR